MPFPRAIFAVVCIATIACAPARNVGTQPTRESGFVTMSDGVRIYFERAGQGPAILFLHGLAGNHAAWFQQVPYFARTYRVITIAQRGFAPSSANRGEYDNGTLVADAIGVLESLGEKDVTVIGQSMGGWTALGIAIERPDLVRSVVLSATVAGIFDDDIDRHYAVVTARARELANEPSVLGSHPAIGRRFAADHPEEAYLYQLLTSFGSPSPGKVAESLGRTRFDDAAIARLRAPVFFVVGEDDEIFPPDIVRRAAARVRSARVATVRGAGHSPYFERPAEWNQRVESFLIDYKSRHPMKEPPGR
jgi:pimeloyl-ACP methyl ester carboxylesterase